MSRAILRSRLLGSLYGLPVGDALGAPYEFRARGAYQPSKEMVPCSTFLHNGKPLPAGSWTDDTSMMLCLAASLNEHHGLNWPDAARKWVKWYQEGYMSVIDKCFDIGNTTAIALGTYSDMIRGSKEFPPEPPLKGSRMQSGNGSLMRLAAIPAYFQANIELALNNAVLSSRITHPSQLCTDSCVLATAYMIGFYHSTGVTPQQRKEEVLREGYVPPGIEASKFESKFETEEVRKIWKETPFKHKDTRAVSTSGFVIHTLDAALWALWKAETFEEGLMLLMPLGSDVDTVGAVYGELAGACFGLEGIPTRWLDALRKKELLDQLFETLVSQSLA